MKRLSLLALILTVGIYAKAQSELTLPFMPGVFQSSFVNPTVIPEHTFSMGFSIYTSPEIRLTLKASGRKQMILCGFESHICVYQTALDLLRHGFG
ncbi:MAG TPA: isochorismatase family protein, partial [Tenuifilaceae bacterium]|nr:isochorismatase family protein [Tenuifilaceae bacterium]